MIYFLLDIELPSLFRSIPEDKSISGYDVSAIVRSGRGGLAGLNCSEGCFE